jgi:hypothetical protein
MRVRKLLFPAMLLTAGFLASASTAAADVVPTFTFRIDKPTSYGGFTVVFESRLSDTSGALPPPLTGSSLRLPAGAKLRPEVLKKRYLCDTAKLVNTLNNSTYEKAKAVCKHAQVGFGTALTDTRELIVNGQKGGLPEVPGTFDLFLSKGSTSKAVASFAILARSDQNSPIVKNAPDLIKNFKVVFRADFLNEPSPDGLFGYRLILPSGPLPGAGTTNIPIVQVKATTKGLTITKKKRSCKKRKNGRCVKRKITREKIFWFTRPKCPKSGVVNFQADYTFEGLAPISVGDSVPCPKFPG